MSFEDFKAKRDELRYWFSSEDTNCVETQVSNLVWNIGAYRIIREARVLSPQDEEGNHTINSLMHGLLDECFFDSIGSAIRRQLDIGDEKKERLHVWSLMRILNELDRHAGLFTREHMLRVSGLPYDYEEDEAWWLNAHLGTRTYPYDYGRKCHRWEDAKRKHEEIDKISGSVSTARKPSDQLDVERIKKLKQRLNAPELTHWVNKFVAHAATVESRAHKPPEMTPATWGHLCEVQEAICRVAMFVHVVLLGGPSGSFFAAPTYDHLRYLECPLVSPEQVRSLREKCEEYRQEVESWGRIDFGEV